MATGCTAGQRSFYAEVRRGAICPHGHRAVWALGSRVRPLPGHRVVWVPSRWSRSLPGHRAVWALGGQARSLPGLCLCGVFVLEGALSCRSAETQPASPRPAAQERVGRLPARDLGCVDLGVAVFT